MKAKTSDIDASKLKELDSMFLPILIKHTHIKDFSFVAVKERDFGWFVNSEESLCINGIDREKLVVDGSEWEELHQFQTTIGDIEQKYRDKTDAVSIALCNCLFASRMLIADKVDLDPFSKALNVYDELVSIIEHVSWEHVLNEFVPSRRKKVFVSAVVQEKFLTPEVLISWRVL